MYKVLFLLIFLVFPHLAFAVDVEAIKADAAQRTGCSKDKPCLVDYKSHDCIYVVEVTMVTVDDSGVTKIHFKEYKRYIYNSEGRMIESLDD